MKEFRIGFRTESCNLNEVPEEFGCTVHSFATNTQWTSQDNNAIGFWDKKIKGKILRGNYQKVLQSLSQLNFKPRACIIFFYRTDLINFFITQICKILPDVPLIGGGVLISGDRLIKNLNTPPPELVLLAAAEGKFSIQSSNIYNKTNITIQIKKTTNRNFQYLRILPHGEWLSAIEFYQSQQELYLIPKDNYELLTFSDRIGRNIHCSIDGDGLKSGADLPDEEILFIRTITNKDAEDRLSEFLVDSNSLIFGCAGIRSLIRKKLFTGKDSLAGFVYGEMVTLNSRPVFGNLMLAKLKME